MKLQHPYKYIKNLDTYYHIFVILSFFILIASLVLYKAVFIANTEILASFWTTYGVIASVFLLSRIPHSYLYEDKHKKYSDDLYPTVSVVIAAKNEELGIFRTIETCIKSEYPNDLECIVVDDGSTDNTNKEVLRAQNIYGSKIKLITFEKNKGKREAMASGVEKSEGEIIVFVDSDSFLSKFSIRHIVEHFLDNPKIGAVSGNTKVENVGRNILTKMQSVQYAISFDVYKASESIYSSVTCCPGCFSAYRKIAIKPLIEEWKNHKFFGSKSTFGDDRGLTNFVLKNNWNVVYCEKAKASTIVPENFKTYWKQQLRWKKSWIREGALGGLFMWKRHPLASLSFYINYTFPFLGPLLVINVLIKSIKYHDPFIFIVSISGFVLLGIVFSYFMGIYRDLKYWFYIPIFSILFVSVFIWQMPYAFITMRKTHWGTR